jgi:exonuclease III
MSAPVMPVGQEPAAVTGDVDRMQAAFAGRIPDKSPRNLLIGTWNIRNFGALCSKWDSAANDRPKRDWHAIACIAKLVERFDVTAIQESRRDTTALQALLARLGKKYRVIASDAAAGHKGNLERLAFVFDSTRVEPSGLVGEIVLPSGVDGPVEQFDRTPYAAGFLRGDVDFILTTVHIRWGKGPADRVDEITRFANWMRDWARRRKDWNHNLLVLGDFNLDRRNDPLYQAFIATGLRPPSELDAVPRTIFDDDRDRHFYDQIAWFSDPAAPGARPLLDGMSYADRSGTFNFVPLVLSGLNRNELSYRISDHYPLWAEFTIG